MIFDINKAVIKVRHENFIDYRIPDNQDMEI